MRDCPCKIDLRLLDGDMVCVAGSFQDDPPSLSFVCNKSHDIMLRMAFPGSSFTSFSDSVVFVESTDPSRLTRLPACYLSTSSIPHGQPLTESRISSAQAKGNMIHDDDSD